MIAGREETGGSSTKPERALFRGFLRQMAFRCFISPVRPRLSCGRHGPCGNSVDAYLIQARPLDPAGRPRRLLHSRAYEAEALFTLVLLAELLVLVLVLAEPMTPSFNWVRLALVAVRAVDRTSRRRCSAACGHCSRACRWRWRGVPVACWWWPSPWAARRSPSTINWAEN